MKEFSERYGAPIFNFDYLDDREFFSNSKEALEKIAESHPIILIDEVQNHPSSTLALKILIDNFPIKIIATGSSEIRQKNQDFDTLAGRTEELYCLPLSSEEIETSSDVVVYKRPAFYDALIETSLVYGRYPEVVNEPDENRKIELLRNIFETYVLKDIIDLYDLKNTALARDILLKIALQIGQEVSFNEIAKSLGANVTTVSNYIQIFVKNYVLIELPAFKTNMRRSIGNNKKYYFLDMGLRNYLLKDFRSSNLRPDLGSVFENLVISEIYKKIRNERRLESLYFYREYGGKEIDLVLEDYRKNYRCLEIKYADGKAHPIFPLPTSYHLLNKENFIDTLEVLFR